MGCLGEWSCLGHGTRQHPASVIGWLCFLLALKEAVSPHLSVNNCFGRNLLISCLEAAIRLWERAAGRVSKLPWLLGVSAVALGCPQLCWGVGAVGACVTGQDPLDFWSVSYEPHPLVL